MLVARDSDLPGVPQVLKVAPAQHAGILSPGTVCLGTKPSECCLALPFSGLPEGDLRVDPCYKAQPHYEFHDFLPSILRKHTFEGLMRTMGIRYIPSDTNHWSTPPDDDRSPYPVWAPTPG